MSRKTSKTTTNSIEETRQYHRKYLIAINSPLRRKILNALKKGATNINQLQEATKLDKATLEWHLSILEYGFCIEKECRLGNLTYKITQEGKVVDYLDK
jgi:DNA-binding transcriptional ArsR family regulator